ncbi:hypothetical protein ACOME3_000272 [Neoechinorhynchus agilis]
MRIEFGHSLDPWNELIRFNVFRDVLRLLRIEVSIYDLRFDGIYHWLKKQRQAHYLDKDQLNDNIDRFNQHALNFYEQYLLTNAKPNLNLDVVQSALRLTLRLLSLRTKRKNRIQRYALESINRYGSVFGNLNRTECHIRRRSMEKIIMFGGHENPVYLLYPLYLSALYPYEIHVIFPSMSPMKKYFQYLKRTFAAILHWINITSTHGSISEILLVDTLEEYNLVIIDRSFQSGYWRRVHNLLKTVSVDRALILVIGNRDIKMRDRYLVNIESTFRWRLFEVLAFNFEASEQSHDEVEEDYEITMSYSERSQLKIALIIDAVEQNTKLFSEKIKELGIMHIDFDLDAVSSEIRSGLMSRFYETSKDIITKLLRLIDYDIRRMTKKASRQLTNVDHQLAPLWDLYFRSVAKHLKPAKVKEHLFNAIQTTKAAIEQAEARREIAAEEALIIEFATSIVQNDQNSSLDSIPCGLRDVFQSLILDKMCQIVFSRYKDSFALLKRVAVEDRVPILMRSIIYHRDPSHFVKLKHKEHVESNSDSQADRLSEDLSPVERVHLDPPCTLCPYYTITKDRRRVLYHNGDKVEVVYPEKNTDFKKRKGSVCEHAPIKLTKRDTGATDMDSMGGDTKSTPTQEASGNGLTSHLQF